MASSVNTKNSIVYRKDFRGYPDPNGFSPRGFQSRVLDLFNNRAAYDDAGEVFSDLRDALSCYGEVTEMILPIEVCFLTYLANGGSFSDYVMGRTGEYRILNLSVDDEEVLTATLASEVLPAQRSFHTLRELHVILSSGTSYGLEESIRKTLVYASTGPDLGVPREVKL